MLSAEPEPEHDPFAGFERLFEPYEVQDIDGSVVQFPESQDANVDAQWSAFKTAILHPDSADINMARELGEAQDWESALMAAEAEKAETARALGADDDAPMTAADSLRAAGAVDAPVLVPSGSSSSRLPAAAALSTAAPLRKDQEQTSQSVSQLQPPVGPRVPTSVFNESTTFVRSVPILVREDKKALFEYPSPDSRRLTRQQF